MRFRVRIWITGSQGQLGHVLLNLLQKKGIDSFGTTREEVDISQEDQVRSRMKGVTHIINAAAFARVDPAETEREKAFRANAVGPEVLALAAREAGARLIHISTDYVFDGTLGRPYREDDQTNPVNWYGQTKLEGELRVQKAFPEACIVRVSWVFGGHGTQQYVHAVLKMLREKRELRFVADQIGRPTYAHDLAEALIVLRDQSGIYHYANRGAISKYDLTCAIWDWAKRKHLPLLCESVVPITAAEFLVPAPRPLSTPFDTAKIEAILPIRSWEEALAECMNRSSFS